MAVFHQGVQAEAKPSFLARLFRASWTSRSVVLRCAALLRFSPWKPTEGLLGSPSFPPIEPSFGWKHYQPDYAGEEQIRRLVRELAVLVTP